MGSYELFDRTLFQSMLCNYVYFLLIFNSKMLTEVSWHAAIVFFKEEAYSM